ncbi:cyclic nucleotide-binding/CBS domain-containing protein [Pseudonocardia alni]|uniref:CBS domain-containing protein n=1 Tax=Pseudonocardia alni TaxID=33907 RepID=UPI0015B7CDA7|nr:CBS domain-containing protein [Pseudonocardia pini]
MSATTTGPPRGPAVRSVLRSPVGEVEWDRSLRDAARDLAADEIGVLLVVRRRSAVGIVSERDLVAAVAEGLDPDDTIVEDAMTTEIVSVDVSAAVTTAAEVMLEAGIRHLLATRDGSPAGIVSIRDVLAAVLEEHGAGNDGTGDSPVPRGTGAA